MGVWEYGSVGVWECGGIAGIFIISWWSFIWIIRNKMKINDGESSDYSESA